MVCRAEEPVLRRSVRQKIERCFADRFYAPGTGKSLTDCVPVEGYQIVLDEGLKAAK